MGIFTITSNDNQAPNPLISWNDTSTTEDRSGSVSTITINIDSITDPEGQSITSIWQINTGSGFIDNVAVTSNPMNFGPNNGVNQYRIKSTDAYGIIGYSNILQYTYSAPQYDNFFDESPRTDCNNGSSTNFISFNSSGGYRTGVNYFGATPVTLRLLSFSDTMVELVGTSEVALSFTPSVLRDSSNTPLTYPYNVSLPSSSVSDVGINQSPASPEITCPSNPGNQVRRRRIITYQVIDTNGTVGPIRTSELDLLYTPQTLPTLHTFGIYVGTDMYTVCTASNPSNIKGFTTTTPNAGSTVYNSDSTPYTGSFSYIKIFNYGDISGNHKVFIVTGGTGVLGSEDSCAY